MDFSKATEYNEHLTNVQVIEYFRCLFPGDLGVLVLQKPSDI